MKLAPAAQSKGRSPCEGFPGALQHRQSAGILQRQRQREQQHSEKLDRALAGRNLFLVGAGLANPGPDSQ